MGKKLTLEDFIIKAKNVHGNKYDYSKVEYINNSTKICIICPEHGEFWQMPYSHLNGNGCPTCGGTPNWNTDMIISEAKKIHGDKYDYSKTEYKNKRTKITIICHEHGEFKQLPFNHIKSKQGCPICGKKVAKDRIGDYSNARKNTDSFKNEISNIFDGKCEVVGEYINNKTKILMCCHVIGKGGKEHGFFQARPDWLVRGHGCPICGYKKSSGEIEIVDFIKEHYNGIIEERNREILNGKEIDIYLPELKLGIEYNGLLWHSEKYSGRMDMKYKTDECEKNGIKLINVFEDEWKNKQDICKSRLLNFLAKDQKIYARKCDIVEISNKEAKNFISENHIQGAINSKYNIALVYNNEIVSVMTFGNLRKNLGSKSKENHYELLRFCNKLNTSVIGGATKLFKYFEKKYSPESVISYADRRWSNGNLYEKMGFTLDSFTVPNYFYITGKKMERINRYTLRKNVLIEKYGCPTDKSEKEFCNEHGLYRLYDCGNRKYVWKKEK